LPVGKKEFGFVLVTSVSGVKLMMVVELMERWKQVVVLGMLKYT
jgi:hypothetical protein